MDAREELHACHDRLRRVDFAVQLRAIVSCYEQEWNEYEDEDEWLLGRMVAAEVYDYFGDYTQAAAALDPTNSRIQETIAPDQAGEDAHKRRIWVTIAFAHALYRRDRQGDHELAARYLQGGLTRLNRLDPHEDRFFGTRARLSYSLGQIARQGQTYDAALRHFGAVCEYAAERFREKTDFIELKGPPADGHTLTDVQQQTLDRERVLATWTIGKSLAFGIGWIHYTTGNLRVARLALNSGYAMLRSTGDWIHRAYAQLLLAAAARAQSKGDSRGLRRSVARVAESEAGLATHPSFRGRAAYERVLGALHSKDAAAALEAIGRAREHFEGAQGMKGTRWFCSLLVLESRAHRLRGDKPAAMRAADAALAKALDGHHVASRVDALLAKAEVSLEPEPPSRAHLSVLERETVAQRRREELGRAVSNIRDAQAVLRGHPNAKMEAACWLHLARACWRLGRPDEARQHFGMWIQEYADRVQHGFLHALADTVAKEIQVQVDRFVLPSTVASLNLDDHEKDLRAFLIRTAATRARTLDEQAQMLGLSPDHLRHVVSKLQASRRDTGPRLGRQRQD